MAVTVETVHSILLELNLPASLEDLRNPTKDFMINIISEFLSRFHIDVATIKKPSLEQANVLRITNAENASIISLINLREIMFVIGNKIFIKGFSIYDITAPGPKRTRKHLKFIANFTLYARNTLRGIRQRIDEVLIRGQQLHDLRKKKQSIIEISRKKAENIARMKADYENLESAIRKVRDIIENKKNDFEKLDVKCKILEREKQQIIERNQIKRAEMKRLEEITEQLRAKVVKEPESLKLRLQELEEECNNKNEKRTVIQEAIQSKQPLIQSLENAFIFVGKQHAKLSEIIDLQKKFMESIQLSESLKRQIEEVKHSLNSEMNKDREDEEKKIENEIQKHEVQIEEKLSKLHKAYNELTVEKKVSEQKKLNIETQEAKCYVERDEIRGKIIEFEGVNSQLLRQCQEFYTKGIEDMENLDVFAVNQMQCLYEQLSNEY